MLLLTPRQAVRRAASILEDHGLEEVARSADSESVYLRGLGSVARLRVSTHRRTPGRRRQYPDVAHSLVFRDPKSERQVRTMAEAALTAFLRASRAGETSSPISRDC